jgi:hypothetical protein
LNNWNGETIVDTENNRILTNAFAAGKMNTDNTFSGVVLGEVGTIADNGTKNSATGLYGYSNGAQAFGFKDDGTAFIGKNGQGRINFNGEKGIIASSSWINDNGTIRSKLEENTSGLLIDLQTGELKSNNFSIDSTGNAAFAGHIEANSGRIGGWEVVDYTSEGAGRPLLYRTNENPPYMFLWPDNPATADSQELSIYKIGDTRTTLADPYTIWGGGKGSYDTDSTTVTGNFGVTKSGILHANNAIISGTINASGGTIGGININTSAMFTDA